MLSAARRIGRELARVRTTEDEPAPERIREAIRDVIARYNLSLDPNDPALHTPSNWEQTLVSRRRAVADIIRLQIYGAMWAATGVDQYYPENYERAQIDLEIALCIEPGAYFGHGGRVFVQPRDGGGSSAKAIHRSFARLALA